jgi:hypothetical protein
MNYRPPERCNAAETARAKRQVARSPQTHVALDEWKQGCPSSNNPDAWSSLPNMKRPRTKGQHLSNPNLTSRSLSGRRFKEQSLVSSSINQRTVPVSHSGNWTCFTCDPRPLYGLAVTPTEMPNCFRLEGVSPRVAVPTPGDRARPRSRPPDEGSAVPRKSSA